MNFWIDSIRVMIIETAGYIDGLIDSLSNLYITGTVRDGYARSTDYGYCTVHTLTLLSIAIPLTIPSCFLVNSSS